MFEGTYAMNEATDSKVRENQVVYPASKITPYFLVQNCEYCSNLKLRVVWNNALKEVYVGNEIVIDQSTNDLYLQTDKPFVHDLLIEAYFD